MKSILQERRECWACRVFYNKVNTRRLEEHHIFQGIRRQASEEYGLKVWLCPAHHRDPGLGVHFDPWFAASLKVTARRQFTRRWPELNFFEIFGKEYESDEPGSSGGQADR